MTVETHKVQGVVVDSEGNRVYLGYIPNLALCVVGLVVFGALAATYRTGLYRQGRRFMLTLCISTTTMAVGFGLMIGCRKHYDSKGWAIAETLFILLSPCGFIAQDYVILPRLATALDASDCLFLRPNWIARIFVGSDIVTFLIQAVGGAMTISNKASTAKTGKTICMVGIFAQLASFCLFTCLVIVFFLKARTRQHVMDQARGMPLGKNWKVVYCVIVWTCMGFIIRSCYRAVEYHSGRSGKYMTNEVWFYCLDALPLALAIAAWAVVWPPHYFDALSKAGEIPMTATPPQEKDAQVPPQ